jgi:hypothetical protein
MTTNKSPIVSDWSELRRIVCKFVNWLELSGHGALSGHHKCDSCNLLADAKSVLGYPSELARALLSIDGSHACALLGENLQDGEAEFVEIVYPDGKNASNSYLHERKAAFKALHNLQARLGLEITYALGSGL